jgi:hypothetical protein
MGRKDSIKTSMLGVLFLLLALGMFPAAHASVPYATGDVFAGVGGGNVSQFTPTGTLKNTLLTTTGSSEETGMCFDSSSNLFVTNFEDSSVSKFDSNGNLIAAHWATFPGSPESCVVNNAGDIFFGGGGLSSIYEYSDSGTSGTLVNSWPVTTQDRGSDWLDLSADQCTMQYTSEGDSILRFNVCTGTQLSNFSDGLPGPCYANRIIPGSGGEVLVACTSQAILLSSTGVTLKSYTISGESFLFALNLDPDGTSFWTAGYETGNIYRIDIATGTVITTFNAPHLFSVAGLAIFNEPTVGCTTCTSTSTTTVQGVPELGTGAGASVSTMLAAAIGILAVSVLIKIKRLPTQRPIP